MGWHLSSMARVRRESHQEGSQGRWYSARCSDWYSESNMSLELMVLDAIGASVREDTASFLPPA